MLLPSPHGCVYGVFGMAFLTLAKGPDDLQVPGEDHAGGDVHFSEAVFGSFCITFSLQWSHNHAEPFAI